MYSKFQLVKKYLHYCLAASNSKGHGIHSPFVFDFVMNELNDKRDFYAYQQVEDLRRQLFENNTVIQVEDFGAGSLFLKTRERSIADIAKHAAKRKKLGQLLFRIASYYQPKTIVELGTSLGLSTAYLAAANPSAKVITLEGATAVGEIAKKNFDILSLHNIELVTGNFDNTVQTVNHKLSTIDLAFVDGNHRKEPTLRYFNELLTRKNNSSLFIFDDIHWSREMEEAWRIIRGHQEVKLTIDLFSAGFIFLMVPRSE